MDCRDSQGEYELAWAINVKNGTIAFNVTFSGAGEDAYFGLGIGETMITADIFAFCAFKVSPCV
jgi:hypothetical protein